MSAPASCWSWTEERTNKKKDKQCNFQRRFCEHYTTRWICNNKQFLILMKKPCLPLAKTLDVKAFWSREFWARNCDIWSCNSATFSRSAFFSSEAFSLMNSSSSMTLQPFLQHVQLFTLTETPSISERSSASSLSRTLVLACLTSCGAWWCQQNQF